MNCKGHFLVASPHLTDKNFYRSVVLMIQHDEEGAFGVVLNRPTRNTIADLWSLIAETPCPKQQPIHMGGPVSGPLIAIHSEAAQSEMEVTEGVYFSTAKEAIIEVVMHASGPFRLFVGYAGWAGGQLDGELEAGGWLTTPATRADIFSDQDDLWNRVSRRIGLDILAPSIKRTEIPDDPSWN
ncbi:MAG: YqgE/AlgH family protein [Planctomycetes bacterium]|nr:YqgE/AlgH family protein [Planctomycetota bacterium]